MEARRIKPDLFLVAWKVETIVQPQMHERRHEDAEAKLPELPSPTEARDRAPYATRLRVVLGLSFLLWAMIALAIAWSTGEF